MGIVLLGRKVGGVERRRKGGKLVGNSSSTRVLPFYVAEVP